MPHLIPLAQTLTPDGIPGWLWAALGIAGGFFMKEVWPAVRGWIDADFKARRTEGRKDAEEFSRRLLAAQETTATALASIAESNKATADALHIFASHRAADSLALDEIRRELRRMRGEPAEGKITPRRGRVATPAEAARAEEIAGEEVAGA